MSSFWALLRDVIPDDHSRQVTAYDMLQDELRRPGAPPMLVDLGCGDGYSIRVARAAAPEVHWIGLDIEESPYASKIQGEDVRIYDGVHFPFEDASIPLFFSHQVLEHVRYPEVVLREVARTLVPGGVLIGSTSQLEPYHAHSLWNYTVYGFRVLVEAAGLVLEEVRPGIDGLTLIRRQIEGRPASFGKWFGQESPLNVEIEEWGTQTDRPPALVNSRKLQFCGHFCFRVRRPMPLSWRRRGWQRARSAAASLAPRPARTAARRLRRGAWAR